MSKGSENSSSKAAAFANQDEILLGVLDAVERDATVSQRTISRELGIALGLANAYLKRCIRKGLIRIQQVPRRRYIYYLTPQGFAEKTRLTGEYLSSSFNFFRQAREQMFDVMGQCAERGWRRIAFAGISELAEVGTICGHDLDVELIAVIAPGSTKETFCGLPVCDSLEDAGEVDAIIVTSLTDSADTYRSAQAVIGAERTFAPALVKLALRTTEPEPSGCEAAE